MGGAFQKYGENMCWGMTVENCVEFWYDEIKNTPGGRLTAANYGASHYSQLVWKATTEVGCGIANTIIVCQFKKEAIGQACAQIATRTTCTAPRRPSRSAEDESVSVQLDSKDTRAMSFRAPLDSLLIPPLDTRAFRFLWAPKVLALSRAPFC